MHVELRKALPRGLVRRYRAAFFEQGGAGQQTLPRPFAPGEKDFRSFWAFSGNAADCAKSKRRTAPCRLPMFLRPDLSAFVFQGSFARQPAWCVVKGKGLGELWRNWRG